MLKAEIAEKDAAVEKEKEIKQDAMDQDVAADMMADLEALLGAAK